MTTGSPPRATVARRKVLTAPGDRLRAHAAAFGEKPALVFPAATGQTRTTTFAELDAESDRYAAGFAQVGIETGTRTVVMMPVGAELVAVIFGLLKLGAVPVIVDPGMGLRRMMRCYRAAGARAFIGVPAAQAVRLLRPDAFAGIRTVVTAGRRWCWGGATLRGLAATTAAPPRPAVEADDLLMISFTSGSTGSAKGVESTHGALAEMVRQTGTHYRHTPSDVCLVTSLSFAFLHLLTGSTCVLPEIDFARVADAEPAMISDLIRRYGVTAMFGSPALLDPLARHLDETGAQVPTLRLVVSGGAPVANEVVARLRRVLAPQGGRMHVTYGATEAVPIASVEAGELLDEVRATAASGGGTCVGRPVDGVDLRVIRATDGPIPDWTAVRPVGPHEIGEIVVSGPTVSRRYLGPAAANANAKIAEAERIWHRTGDLGRVDEQGRIWFAGRRSDVVHTADGPLYPVPCETVLDEHPEVRRTALVGVGLPGRQQPVVCVELRAGVPATRRPSIERELRELAQRHEATRCLTEFLFHPSFPVDVRHNAKIDHGRLAAWAARTRTGGTRRARCTEAA
ncbi:AMP-binding protein [Micromonospora sp. WP24]|uniref:fatty acid CoA ligase family protein n=1 Tax=Micromonospora sp. WP24 TaxID=2604469 RepID=UPI0011D971AA|nr:fatty acid CoA ligase family protein [Micromonospora sp. WP24]TYC02622.1 AMP-binding protein [Micromonospora sp. WP24]